MPESIHMTCYDVNGWHGNFYGSCNCSTFLNDLDDGSIDIPGFRDEMREAREWYLSCWLGCESSYCQQKCNELYREMVQEILDEYVN